MGWGIIADLLAFVDAVFILEQYAMVRDSTGLTNVNIKSRAMRGHLGRVIAMVGQMSRERSGMGRQERLSPSVVVEHARLAWPALI